MKNIIFEKIYYPYKKIILDIFENLENGAIKKEDFTLKKFISFLNGLEIESFDYLKNYKDGVELSNNEVVINNLQDIENIIEKIKKNKIIEIIYKLNENITALKFLLSITTKDCINMQEFAGEVFGGNNQTFLSLEDLSSIEKLVELFEIIKNYNYEENKNNEKEIIKYLEKELIPEEKNLINYFNNYHEYEQFFKENLNSSKYISETIQKILNNSKFFLLNNDKEFFNGFIINEENKAVFIDYNFLMNLRERAINNRYKKIDYNKNYREKIDKYEEITIKNNKIFIEFVRQINELLKLIKKISKKGIIYKLSKEEEEKISNKKSDTISYLDKIENNFFLFEIRIQIKEKDGKYYSNYFFNEEEKKTFNEIYSKINDLYNSINTIQKNSYLQKNYINFIYGNQFQMIFEYILTNQINKNLKYFLNSFFDNENIKIEQENKDNIKIDLNQNFNSEIYNKYIDECDKLLQYIIKINHISLNNIYQKNSIKEKFSKYIGIYINGCFDLEKEIIQYYKYFTNNMPLSSTLLLCDEKTTSEEIMAFFYRTTLCQQHICFCFANPESLSRENKTFVINLLRDIFKEGNISNNLQKMKSCLFIMTRNLEDELCKSLFNFKYIKLLENIKEIEEEKIEDDNIKIIYSDFSGVGKSTYIKGLAKSEYIYFPVGGVFSKEEILERLKKMDEEKNTNNINDLLFHIDLYDTEQKSIMNEFLYFILVTKTFGKENNIFYLSRKIKVYLEIPNSFINFFEKFPIIDIIDKNNRIELKLNNLPPLIVPDDLLSEERIVSLFLKLLKEENTVDKNISLLLKANNKIDKNEIIFLISMKI